MSQSPFTFESPMTPAGDQPAAIRTLVEGANGGERDQVLLGVTGSGKTFAMAKVIEATGRPALIMAHNKVLAAQLYEEFKTFFPHNAVEYFVSYYDYYQPEAYVPRNDLYIEKTADINEEIDRMRHAATRALFERPDVIIVASVSCIYGIGDPESYSSMTAPLKVGGSYPRDGLLKRLVEMQYTRNDAFLERGSFRARGDVVDIFPSHLEACAWRVSFFDEEVEEISAFDPLTGEVTEKLEAVTVYPNSHHVVPRPTVLRAMEGIKAELKERLAELSAQNKLVEAQRLEERTRFDLEMMQAVGYCNGIENYSRHLTGREPGTPPPTLFDYLPPNALLFVDESHVTVPQIGGMSRGDRQRKTTLAEYGFRLPSCVDNRPLSFEEWDTRRPQTVYVSATPGEWELKAARGRLAEMIVRPTGLLDPPVEIRPVEGGEGTMNQVDDLFAEIGKTTKLGFRTLVTTLTKKMAEQLTEYLHEHGVKVRYMHSDIDTLERAEIIRDLRLGVFDVLVGINLLREGLDIPEVALVAVLDADKEGFLRSTTSLIQTIGRAARNSQGRVILYADTLTGSINAALAETERRRAIQAAHNKEHNITPQSVTRAVGQGLAPSEKEKAAREKAEAARLEIHSEKELERTLKTLRKQMYDAAENLEFEKAATLRDQLQELEALQLGV